MTERDADSHHFRDFYLFIPRTFLRHVSLSLLILAHTTCLAADEAPPKSVDPRFKVELFAEQPQIVTPTGIDVDDRGYVWAVESNTHFPPAGYQGHPTDRVLVMSDSDGDGKADRVVVFTDGLKFTMSVAVRPLWLVDPKSSESLARHVYLATRREIRLYRDTNGDDQADESSKIVELETKGDYPHNGLAGFAFDALGWLYFGCGENLGADYRLVGSDGTAISGGGEGGSIYRCRLDGSRLERVATGFWNPHANCCDAFGRLFSVDNDPDSRPPCRLMHIIPGGDYGYRYRNGRKGLHPFTAWNGEIPGTLPMVAGTGEAPSGVLACESDGLPEDFTGNLLATSWGDHRIDRFRLKASGASFHSATEPLIVGGENFRPVGIAAAPDGSFYFTDWVKRDYKLHGHGRVWRISPLKTRETPVVAINKIGEFSLKEQQELLNSSRLDVRRMAARQLAASPEGIAHLFAIVGNGDSSDRARVEALWGLAFVGVSSPDKWQKLKLFKKGDSLAAAACLLNPQLLHEKPGDLQQVVRGLIAERLAGRSELLTDPASLAPLLARAIGTDSEDLVIKALSLDDPFLFSVVVTALAKNHPTAGFALYLGTAKKYSPRVRQAMVLASRISAPQDTNIVTLALKNSDPDVKRLAVQWAAEEKHASLRPEVEEVFDSTPMTSDLFMATVAALEMLDGANPAEIDKVPASKYVLPLLLDEKRSVAVRIQALRLVSPQDPALTTELFEKLLKGNADLLKRETVRTLQLSSPQRAAQFLVPLATEEKHDLVLRADAVSGLGAAAAVEPAGGATRKLIAKLFASTESAVQLESLRDARGPLSADPVVRDALKGLAEGLKPTDGKVTDSEHNLADQIAMTAGKQHDWLPASLSALLSKRPSNLAEWQSRVERGPQGDKYSGRRLFFHVNGPGCSRCHTINGRGGHVGPDLSRIGEMRNRQHLIESILEPGREIAPQFVNWSFETVAGKVLTGMIVFENEGKTTIGDAEGKLTELKTIDIVDRSPQSKSVMPERLIELMTVQDFIDLVTYLESLK